MKKSRIYTVLMIAVVGAICIYPARAQTQNFDAVIAQFENYMQQQIADSQYIGVSVAFNYGGYYWEGGFGTADVEHGVPATAESVYRLASVTKPMTAVGILKLVDAGKIDLDAEVQEYVPYFPVKQWPVTIRQLLGHLSGISHYKDYDAEARTMKQMSTEEALDIFKDWDLLFEPGAEYSYTTYGYNLLGAVIEAVSDMSYGEYMRTEVWEPLGMTHTRVDVPFDIIENRVEGYVREGGILRNSYDVNLSLKYAGGGTVSTVGDMVKFARGISQGEVLSDSLRELMWTEQVTNEGIGTGYGLGWGMWSINGRFSVDHTGGQEGTRTFLSHLPSHDLTIAVASNYENSNGMAPGFQLYELIFDEPLERQAMYTGSLTKDLQYEALRWTFTAGFAHYDRYRKPMTTSHNELVAAFGYFKQVTDPDYLNEFPEEAGKLIAQGRHPAAESAFEKAGSYMVHKLHEAHGDEYLRDAHGNPMPQLFADYAAWYQEAGDVRDEYKFTSRFAETVSKWSAAYNELWGAPELLAAVDLESDTDSLSEALQRRFDGYDVYPDYSNELQDLAEAALARNQPDMGMAFAQVMLDVYPRSDDALTFMGVLHVAFGDSATARTYIDSAAVLVPDGAADASGLNTYAYGLMRQGLVDQGITLLNIAIDKYPDVANLYDSKGEFYLNKGNVERAIEFYEKAAAMDPDFQNPRNMLKRIRESQQQSSR